MFGKVWVPAKGHKATKPGEGPGSFQSMCVQVTGLERQLFFLPTNWKNPEEVNKAALANEITKLIRKGPLNRNQSESLRMKMVTRNYAFELQGIPRENCEYMKVKYSAKYGMLDQDVTGEHFSKVFGAKTNCLENFLLKRRIMGPCWIEVREPTKGQNASWCNVEALVDDSKLISVCSGSRNLEAPPIVVMSLDIKTRVNKKQEHEIVMISALVHKDVLTDKPTPNEMGRNNIAHFTVGRRYNRRLRLSLLLSLHCC
jgi:DNA polymerase alpha subunit A